MTETRPCPFPYDSRDVAAFAARCCIAEGYEHNITKIQKLVYCAYGVVLAARGIRLCDESPKAGQYGPVFPGIFRIVASGRELPSTRTLCGKACQMTCDHLSEELCTSLAVQCHRTCQLVLQARLSLGSRHRAGRVLMGQASV